MAAHRVNRTEFLQMLGRVDPGLAPKKGSVEQGTCYVFEDSWLLTFNDEIACRTFTGLPAEFKGAVPADPLKRALERVPAVQDDMIRVESTGREFVVRWSDRKNDVVAVRAEADVVLPIDAVETPAKEDWAPLYAGKGGDVGDAFRAAVELVQEVAGSNKDEFLCLCVHLHPDYMEASDKRQAVRYAMPTGVREPCLVRQSAIKHVVSLGMVKIAETPSWVHFRNKHLIFSCRRYVEDYLDLDSAFAFRGAAAELPRGGEQAAQLAAVFVNEADPDNNKVTVVMDRDRMTVRGEGAAGYASREMDMKYAGEPLAFRVRPGLLEQLIRKNNTCEIGAPGGKYKLKTTGDSWVYSVALAAAPTDEEDRARVRPDDGRVERGDDDPEFADVGDDGDGEAD